MSVPPHAVQLNEANDFLKKHPEVQFVDLLIADMNGVVRGKRIERASLHNISNVKALGISERTVRRDWRKARAFLLMELRQSPGAAASIATSLA